MAVIVQTVTATQSFVPYERPPDIATLWSAIPRGLLSLLVPFQAVDDKPSPDDLIFEIRATLPPNFGYVMNDAAWTLSGALARAFDWDDLITLNIQNFYRSNAPNAVTANYQQPSSVHTLDIFTRSMVVSNPWPHDPMIAGDGSSGILINWNTFNTVSTATVGGIVSAFMSFWQFDLEQIRKYPINSPVPTHAR